MKTMSISAGTIARTIVLVIALVNQVLTTLGYSPIPVEDETVVEVISLCFTIVASLVTWWKNQSFTKAAIAGDNFMNAVRNRENDI